ncbi:hypothetical protein EXS71_02755 [Candidatus Uhrbacteria bacterium]|nr:hypothetical protein [Candidatus Uhrbacteria bacterium]
MNDIIDKEILRKMCYTETGAVRPKAECRAEMINRIILDEHTLIDIDEAENFIDKTLREFNLWNEPTLEDLLKDDEPEATKI